MRRIVPGFCLVTAAGAIMHLYPAHASAAEVTCTYGQDTVSTRLAAATVRAWRPAEAAGIQRTAIDSIALKENISLSFADILSYNSSVFVKQYGRATPSTVSFRGTSASHTQVLWNGMKINSPMLGMTDFSMIPAFLTDRAGLLHGQSSLSAVSGGIGGAVMLETLPPASEGLSMQFVQGLGSFLTVDDFLRLSYRKEGFHVSMRTVFSFSPNRFRYINTDKKEFVYDEEMNIVSSHHPAEYNENGKYMDAHVLLEGGYETRAGDRFRLSVWGLMSGRQLPRLTVDYSDADGFINEQRENTLRAVLSYRRTAGDADISVSAGYSGTGLKYDYAFDAGKGNWSTMNDSHSAFSSMYLDGDMTWHFSRKLTLRAGLSLYRQHVKSLEKVTGQGYDVSRTDGDILVSLNWKPAERAGISLTVREEAYGKRLSLPVPAVSADVLIWKKAGMYLKASAGSNYRYPTLNDMYFLPGGNPDLRPETGFSYDAGYSLSRRWKTVSVSAAGTWFDSRIKDWILWLPYGPRKNFYTPQNLLEVHSYGIEQKIGLRWEWADGWTMEFKGNFTWSPAKNVSGTGRDGDMSAGKQLVYVPEYSASATGSLSFRKWRMLYKWCWYSRRYVMTSNETGPSGSVPPYIMNGLMLSREVDFRRAGISLSLAVNNLFNEHYVTVLSRPMPGINFEFFIGITPRWGMPATKKE